MQERHQTDQQPLSTNRKKHTVLVALFVGLLILINAPLMTAANLPDRVMGLPRLYVYVFSVWAISIVALALLSSRLGGGGKKRGANDQ